MKDAGNIYRAARMKAAQKEPLFSSRERASGVLYVSREALYDYETGTTLPPCDVVQRMIEAYGTADLRRQHIRAICPLLPDYGGETGSELAQAALRWVVELSEIHETALNFASLARDGRVTADEIRMAHEIRAKAYEVRRIMEDTIMALDDAIGQGGACGK